MDPLSDIEGLENLMRSFLNKEKPELVTVSGEAEGDYKGKIEDLVERCNEMMLPDHSE